MMMISLFIGLTLLSSVNLVQWQPSFILLTLLFMFLMKVFLMKTSFLSILLSLELASLASILSMTFLSSTFSIPLMFFMTFFTFMVCEASMGLCLLVMSSRNKGNDFISS